MVKGIEHAAIFSADTESLRDWYVSMFDLKVVYDNGKGTYFLTFPNGDMIEMVKSDMTQAPQNDKQCGIRHLALAIDADKFNAMADKLKSSGAEVVTDVAEAPNGIKTFFFRDPDGNVSHLIYRPNSLV